MTFDSLIHTFPNTQVGKNACVLSSRIRLARNLSTHPFPGWAQKPQRVETYQQIIETLSSLPCGNKSFMEELKEFDSLQKQVLVEQHLMSRELAARSTGCGLLVNESKTLSIMINEEDHFRLQSIQPGLSLKKAFRAIDKIDTEISAQLTYAYSPELGFLTSCPSNVGTGMRASVMLHLPALVLTDQIKPVLKAVSRLGLAIRGFYGEGTESLGHLYQISNQSTLGESEHDIITRIERIVKYVITAEENARAKTLQDSPLLMIDKVSRAYGTLKYAYTMTSKEALTLISLLRLGAVIGYFPNEVLSLCDHLMIKIQPAHLQLNKGTKLDAEERDRERALTIAEAIREIPPPALPAVSSETVQRD